MYDRLPCPKCESDNIEMVWTNWDQGREDRRFDCKDCGYKSAAWGNSHELTFDWNSTDDLSDEEVKRFLADVPPHYKVNKTEIGRSTSIDV
jgi:hypothetical protein